MSALEELLAALPGIEERLGYVFRDKSLLVLAFVHRSFVNESKEVDGHNERLEFLGDSVLGLLIAERLYRNHPEMPEGELSAHRSRLVEASSCKIYMEKLDISSHLLLGRGEKMNDGRGRDSILADLFEALIGAIYLDGGFEAASAFLFHKFKEEMSGILAHPLKNWKAYLQEYCQHHFQQAPIYKVLEEVGPDHSKTFQIVVLFNGQEQGMGSGASKKEAQQAAAADALFKLGEIR